MVDGVSQKIQHFLYVGQDEIGSLENGQITELRIVGEGNGAEIGSAVAIELDNRILIPIHNMRGDICCLIDSKSKEIIQNCQFSAFGEQSTESIIPWGFSSKRLDPETGFIYFGRRYYSPSLGRWITPDPIGFRDGPNLYAYVHNSPLTHFDLYGLETIGGLSNFSLFNQSFQSSLNSTLGLNHAYPFNPYPNHKPITSLFSNSFTRFMGAMQAYGGLMEAKIGIGLSFTGIGTPFGIAMIGHGIDNYCTGMRTFFSGAYYTTASSHMLQRAGFSQNIAENIDIGIGLTATLSVVTKSFTQKQIANQANRNSISFPERMIAKQRMTSNAENVNAGINLSKKLSRLESFQQIAVKTRTLPDGRIRYYDIEKPSRILGSTRGACNVLEWNPMTGNVRGWYECYDHLGVVNRIHPKNINGQVISSPHYPPTGLELLK